MHVRPATIGDLGPMVESMFAEPSTEQTAFMPTITGARRFVRELWQIAGLENFAVADDDGAVIGFAWWSTTGPSVVGGGRAAISGWGLAGPIRLAARGWPRQLVEIPLPEGVKLLELQTHPRSRGGGVGTMLLTHVIKSAGDTQLSLTTRSDNPARRLYERHGFVVRAERTHRSFERRTGSPGRILMVRPAIPQGAPGPV